MSKEKYKLHPVAVIINFAKGLKDLIIPFLIIFTTNGFDFSMDTSRESFWIDLIPMLIVAAVAIVYLMSGILKWWTFVYWFEDNELRVKYGLFIKKKRFIPFDRIQSFNYKEGIFHRMFGLVQVIVETAGSTNGKPEVELIAITKNAANQIEIVMQKAKQKVTEVHGVELGAFTLRDDVHVETPSRVVYKMSSKDLVILATTSSGIGVVLTGIVAILSQFAEFIPYDWLYEEIAEFIKVGFLMVAMTLFSAFLFAWIIAVLITFINYYNFTVTEENERLIVTRGLLEKKRVTIPLNRVQAIKIVENPLRQLFGLVTVVIESASGGFGEKEKKMTLIPLVSKQRMYTPLTELFPQYKWHGDMIKPPKRAKPFFYRIDLIWIVPVIGFCSYFFFPFGLFSILTVVPAFLLGMWQYRTTGIAIDGNQMTFIYRIFSRTTFVVERKRIQAVEKRQSYFQKRSNVASIQATVMSGLTGATAKAIHLEEKDVELVMTWFER